MKKIIITLLCFCALTVQAQQNIFLTSGFWQSAPSVEMVKAEIAKGNDPSQSNAMSMDAVVMAINAQAPVETIKFLLDQPGNNPDKLTHDGRIYLHWAANRGNTQVMEYLLTKGSKIAVMDTHGTTPLLFAAGSGQTDTKVYDILLAHGDNLKTNINGDGANALLLAIANDKDLALTNYFISKGLSLNSVDGAGSNAFAYAARSANMDLLKTLVQKGVKPSPTAMLMAAQAGGGRRGGPPVAGAGVPLYVYLESLGIKPTATNKSGENILHALVRKQGQQEQITYFLGKGVDVNKADEDGNTVLMAAATANRDTSVLALLLSKIKNINQLNTQGVSALAMAVRSNSPAIVTYLISKGADVKTVDKKGNNLAYYLIEGYRPQMQSQSPGQGGQAASAPQGERQGGRSAGGDELGAKMAVLKTAGFDLAKPQQNGNTIYHLAVAKNNLALLKRIEPLGVDVNAKNKEGITALHKAAMIAKDDILLQYLVSIGAKKEVGTGFNETAYDLATANETLTKNHVSVNFLK